MPIHSSAPPRIILGIDPGLRITGFGVIQHSGSQLRYLASGTIKTPDADLAERLGVILRGVREVISTYRPHFAAIEKVFVNVNPQSTLLLGQARGAALCALVDANLPITEYSALQLKQATVGYGRASKEQMQSMVQRLLKLPALPGKDAADALAAAICHVHSSSMQGAVGGLAPSLVAKGYRVRKGRLVQS